MRKSYEYPHPKVSLIIGCQFTIITEVPPTHFTFSFSASFRNIFHLSRKARLNKMKDLTLSKELKLFRAQVVKNTLRLLLEMFALHL